jgi:hypothetical protein
MEANEKCPKCGAELLPRPVGMLCDDWECETTRWPSGAITEGRPCLRRRLLVAQAENARLAAIGQKVLDAAWPALPNPESDDMKPLEDAIATLHEVLSAKEGGR